MSGPRNGEEYLADGVYASFDGARIWLRTERDGREHLVAVEQDVLDGLDRYVRRLAERRSKGRLAS